MRIAGIASLALAGGVLACSGTQEPTPQPNTTTMPKVVDNAFSPTTTTVAAGATVTWTWQSANDHSVTFASGPSSPIQSSGTFQRTFSVAGVYSYFCSVHGAAVMSGTVSVGQNGGGGGDGGGDGGGEGCAPYCIRQADSR